jgi:hypothetical protein
VGKGVDEDEGAQPLGLGDREMDRPHGGRIYVHQRRSLEADCVEPSDAVSDSDLCR